MTVLALDLGQRDTISPALIDCSDGLAKLRGVLLRQHAWRRREGLV